MFYFFNCIQEYSSKFMLYNVKTDEKKYKKQKDTKTIRYTIN